MQQWLDRVLPPGPWHNWVVPSLAFSLQVLGTLALFFASRWLLLRALGAVMAPIARHDGGSGAARVRTLEGLVRSAITYTLLLFAAVAVLRYAGVDVTAIIAGAGVAGLALSFGAQRLVRDLLTGFFLLLEDQYRVDEVVTLMGIPALGQAHGTVTEIGLRTTRLRDPAGRTLTVSNGDVGAVLNHSRGPVTVSVELGVPSGTGLQEVRAAMKAAALPEALFTGSAVADGISGITAEKVTVRITAAAAPGMAPEAELALRESAAAALRAAGLELR